MRHKCAAEDKDSFSNWLNEFAYWVASYSLDVSGCFVFSQKKPLKYYFFISGISFVVEAKH